MKFLISLILTITIFTNPSEDAGIAVGDVAPEFSLKNVDGSMVSLEDYTEGQGVILIFSCNSCPFVVKYEDRMIELDNQFRGMGWPVVAINPNDIGIKPSDSFEEMVLRSEEKGFPFQYLRDETQEVAKAYGATRTPQVYLLQKVEEDFKVVYIGAIDDNVEFADQASDKYVENAIMALQIGDPPNPDFTKAIGCTIKWTPEDN